MLHAESRGKRHGSVRALFVHELYVVLVFLQHSILVLIRVPINVFQVQIVSIAEIGIVDVVAALRGRASHILNYG